MSMFSGISRKTAAGSILYAMRQQPAQSANAVAPSAYNIKEIMKKEQKPRQLTCTHCGNSAGRFLQWWNHDDGFGACRSCIDWVVGRENLTSEQIRNNYGDAGVHYANPVQTGSTIKDSLIVAPSYHALFDGSDAQLLNDAGDAFETESSPKV